MEIQSVKDINSYWSEWGRTCCGRSLGPPDNA